MPFWAGCDEGAANVVGSAVVRFCYGLKLFENRFETELRPLIHSIALS